MEEKTTYDERPTKEEMAKLLTDMCEKYGYRLQASLNLKQQIDTSFTLLPTIVLVDVGSRSDKDVLTRI
jgi:hypothetical protein